MFGFICNLMVKPVPKKFHIKNNENNIKKDYKKETKKTLENYKIKKSIAKIIIYWLIIGIPLAWGFSSTLKKAYILCKLI